MNHICTFPNSLKHFRRQAGLRQLDVAAMLGHTSADRISHWEKGFAAPSLINLLKLSSIYRTPVEELYTEVRVGAAAGLKKPENSTVNL